MSDIEITKREILVSISIIAILLILGFWISGKISDSEMDQNEIYNKAIKIESQDLFEYGMRTNVGNAFVYGELKAIDPVSYPDVKGKYMYIEQIKEEYTKHTREVRHDKKDSKGKVTGHYYTTETYWEWDWVDTESKQCKQVSFSGVTFNVNKINYPGTSYIDTIKESHYIRYSYYGTGSKFKGTIFADLRDKTIPDSTKFYEDMTIAETVDMLEYSGGSVIVFWVVWVALICGCVYGFYKIDNRWLE